MQHHLLPKCLNMKLGVKGFGVGILIKKSMNYKYVRFISTSEGLILILLETYVALVEPVEHANSDSFIWLWFI